MKKWIFHLLFLLLISSESLSVGLITEGMTEEQITLYRKVGNELRCPTCTGVSILQSEATFSMQLRRAVREQVLAGKTAEEIMLYFTERYGNWIMREPPKEGFHLVAWGIPVLFALLGAFSLWVFIWRKRRTISTYGVRSSREILEEMEQELKLLSDK